MKKASGRFIGGFYGLSPFEKYSDVAPLLRPVFSPSPSDQMPKLGAFLSRYGITKAFIKKRTQQSPGLEMGPGQGN